MRKRKMTRAEEISTYVSICGTADIIEDGKKMLRLMNDVLLSLDDPAPEELQLICDLKIETRKILEGYESILEQMLIDYQGTIEGPVEPPEWFKKKTESKSKKEK